MLSRRRFLQSSAIAGTAALPAIAHAGESHDCKPLPPAVAELTSFEDQANPITAQERAARQEKARQLMQVNGLDAILLGPGTSLRYFSGVHWWESERLFAMVLPRKGEPFFVSPAFERGRAAEQLANSPQAANPDIRVWHEDENPYERVAQGLRDAGISAGTLGMEETVRFVFTDSIAKAAPSLKIVSATPVTAGCA